MTRSRAPLIDALQYVNWTEDRFRELRAGGLDAIHVTIAYHENFREVVLNLEQWNRWFRQFPDLIFAGRSAADIRSAMETGRTAVFFGFQNPSPIEDDLGRVEILYQLGVRFMQLTYNNQSLLAAGCFEAEDSGVTRFGREVISEMNRVGMAIDMSHSAQRSTLDAIALSNRPIAITHANPASWHAALRNKSDDVIKALTEAGGMMGFSLYPHHLRGGSDCTRDSFCAMIADTVSRFGIDHFGIGSDLCQDHPDSIVTWMRNGRWSQGMDLGEGDATNPGFPPQPKWFESNLDFKALGEGLANVGFDNVEIDALLGKNWENFFARSFSPKEVVIAD